VKLHELKPAPGSRVERTRVGRGIAAGKGKTAGRGTKGQKARAGGSIPPWFEGGQTPLHMRVPKLRGFRRPQRIDYQVVNVGRISEYAAAGRFGVEVEAGAAGSGAPLTVNIEVLRRAGLVGSDRDPVKVLGNGDVTEKLFVAADAFTRSARAKIEAAGGFVQLLAPERAGEDAADETAAEPAAEAAAADEPAAEAQPTDESGAQPATAQLGAEMDAPTPPAGVAEAEPDAAPEAPTARGRTRRAAGDSPDA
jgi:large subunit ribosomal protein L15